MPCSYQVAEKLVLKLATCGMRGAMLRGPFALLARGCRPCGHVRTLAATAGGSVPGAARHGSTWHPVPPSRFNYNLPDERIASRPHQPRDQSRRQTEATSTT